MRSQVGVFALAFGLETYHHHKFHGGEDAASGGEDANGKEKESAAASAREAMGAVSSLDDEQREVDALGARVRAMRETMTGR